MDVEIDGSSVFFGTKNITLVEEDFKSLCQAMNSITLGSEVPSASLFESAKKSMNDATNTTIHNLLLIYERTKRILEDNDRETALLFKCYEEGILTEDGKWLDVPLMNQDDYGDIPYSSGSVKSSGCGITSLCMVASYILGDLYTPEELASIAMRDRSSNAGRIESTSNYLDLNWVKNSATSKQDLVNMLEDGKMVIVLVKNSSHFVLCKGITPDGKILVNDPYSPFRQAGLENGYTWNDLKFTSGNTWAFDPSQSTGAKVSDKISISGEVASKLNDHGIDLNAMNDVVPDGAPKPPRDEEVEAPDTEEPPQDKEQVPEEKPTPPEETQPEQIPEEKPAPPEETQPEQKPEPPKETQPEQKSEEKPPSPEDANSETNTEPAKEIENEKRTENQNNSQEEPKVEQSAPIQEQKSESTYPTQSSSQVNTSTTNNQNKPHKEVESNSSSNTEIETLEPTKPSEPIETLEPITQNNDGYVNKPNNSSSQTIENSKPLPKEPSKSKPKEPHYSENIPKEEKPIVETNQEGNTSETISGGNNYVDSSNYKEPSVDNNFSNNFENNNSETAQTPDMPIGSNENNNTTTNEVPKNDNVFNQENTGPQTSPNESVGNEEPQTSNTTNNNSTFIPKNNNTKTEKKQSDNSTWIKGAIGVAAVATTGLAAYATVKKAKKNNE